MPATLRPLPDASPAHLDPMFCPGGCSSHGPTPSPTSRWAALPCWTPPPSPCLPPHGRPRPGLAFHPNSYTRLSTPMASWNPASHLPACQRPCYFPPSCPSLRSGLCKETCSCPSFCPTCPSPPHQASRYPCSLPAHPPNPTTLSWSLYLCPHPPSLPPLRRVVKDTKPSASQQVCLFLLGGGHVSIRSGVRTSTLPALLRREPRFQHGCVPSRHSLVRFFPKLLLSQLLSLSLLVFQLVTLLEIKVTEREGA